MFLKSFFEKMWDKLVDNIAVQIILFIFAQYAILSFWIKRSENIISAYIEEIIFGKKLYDEMEHLVTSSD